MKARYKHLLEHSLGFALSAVEAYNKPSFREREQVFSVLLVGAWESLLKSKILKTNSNRLNSLYIRDGAHYKKNRSGQYLTIDILAAARKCDLNAVAIENLERLVEIRDAAIHLTADSPTLPLITYRVGLAGLQNYLKAAGDWFSVSVDDYDFFILPIGFSYPFLAIEPAQLRREPRDVANLVRGLVAAQESGKEESEGYYLAFEIKTHLVSAKKLTGPADFTAAVDQEGSGMLIERRVRLVDQYPLAFRELWRRIKVEHPTARQNVVFQIIRDAGIKGDPTYSAYNWRTKADELRGATANAPCIYNEAALRLILEELRRREPTI